MKNLFAAALLAVSTIASAQIVPNYPAAEYYIVNNSNSGRQGLRVDAAPNNNHGIAIMGLASSATSTAGYFQNTEGTSLLTLGTVKHNLYGNKSLEINHTTNHIRMTNGAPGSNAGYGVVMGNDGTNFYIGVTAYGDANGPVQRRIVMIDLASGLIVQPTASK